MEEASVPVNVSVLLAVKVLPSAMVKVAAVAGAVRATLLMEVAVATPRTGVVRVGVVPKTAKPVPVSSETDDNNAADVMLAAAVVYTVPLASPKVYVRSAVKSAVVIMPANLPTPPAKGRN